MPAILMHAGPQGHAGCRLTRRHAAIQMLHKVLPHASSRLPEAVLLASCVQHCRFHIQLHAQQIISKNDLKKITDREKLSTQESEREDLNHLCKDVLCPLPQLHRHFSVQGLSDACLVAASQIINCKTLFGKTMWIREHHKKMSHLKTTIL